MRKRLILVLLSVLCLSVSGCRSFMGRMVIGDSLKTAIENTHAMSDQYFEEANKTLLEHHPQGQTLVATGEDLRIAFDEMYRLIESLFPEEEEEED